MGSAKHSVLKFFIVVILILWMFMWFMRPLEALQTFWRPAQNHTRTRSYDHGTYILMYSAPLVIVGIAGAIAYHHKRNEAPRINGSSKLIKSPLRNTGTYPLFIKGPLSMTSTAEFMALIALISFTVYTFAAFYIKTVNKIDKEHLKEPLSHRKLKIAGLLGQAGLFCMATLFFPVTRGSTLHRLLNIPFEQAIKFHTWIGMTMMLVWTAHGLIYVVYWIMEEKSHEMWSWHENKASGLSGLMALGIGLAMVATSLSWFRKKNFQIFYYVHHLYIPFILFFAVHIGDRLYVTALGGIILFFASRLLRFLQSRQRIDAMAARLIGNDTVELVFPKLPDVHYSAASFVFINLPAVSRLEWHPFTVTSSSNVEPDRLTLLIKRNGDWTSKLVDKIQKSRGTLHLEARIEGPYGHDIDYIVRYETIIFIAGGSGISPFLSLLKEILYNIQAKTLPPKEIIFIYTTKTSEELAILNSIAPPLICPEFASSITIDIQAYVTREQLEDLEEQHPSRIPQEIQLVASSQSNTKTLIHAEPSPNSIERYAAQQLRAIAPPLSASGIVEASVILFSFLAFMLLAGIVGRFWLYIGFTSKNKTFNLSIKAFLSFLETIVGVAFGGGAAAYILSFFVKKNKWCPSIEGVPKELSLQPKMIQYGKRPDFQSIFAGLAKRCENNVGVFVCGSVSMQQDVAFECRFYRRTERNATFHFHPLNFDL